MGKSFTTVKGGFYLNLLVAYYIIQGSHFTDKNLKGKGLAVITFLKQKIKSNKRSR